MRKATELFGAAWSNFYSQPKLYISIYLLPFLFSLVFVVLDLESVSEKVMAPWEIITVVIFILISIVVNIMMGVALILVASGRSTTFMDAYNSSIKYLWRYFLVGLVGGLAVFFGLILLIVPGIILAVWFSQAYMITVLEDKGVINSLKKSKEYVTGRWWAVAWRIVFLIIALIVMTAIVATIVAALSAFIPKTVASILVYLANCVIVPLSIIYSYHLYADLSGRPNLASTNVNSSETPVMNPSE